MRIGLGILIAIAIIAGAYTLWFTGGDQQGELLEQPGGQNPTDEPGANTTDFNAQWSSSGHAKVVEDTVRDGCISCHTEQGFVQEDVSAEQIQDPRAQTCNACHDNEAGNENNLRKIDPVSLPNKVTVDRGDSNLCINCHNSRRNIDDQATRAERRAPHSSPQSDMLAGTNAWEFGKETLNYQNSAHTGFENPCVTCHMAQSPQEGQPGFNQVGEHTFKISTEEAFNQNACVECHPQTKGGNRPAYDDYDGDGTLEGIQSEVSGLLELLKAEIEKKIDNGRGGTLSESHGRVQFLKADGQTALAPEEMDEELYLAAYNYFFVENDGSHGVHNPPYAVMLLQQSYKAVTGKDVPGAAIR